MFNIHNIFSNYKNSTAIPFLKNQNFKFLHFEILEFLYFLILKFYNSFITLLLFNFISCMCFIFFKSSCFGFFMDNFDYMLNQKQAYTLGEIQNIYDNRKYILSYIATDILFAKDINGIVLKIRIFIFYFGVVGGSH